MLEGGCFCGAVRYRIEGEASASGICHCRTCRKIASAPTLPFVTFKEEQVSFTRGKPVQFCSSPPVVRTFCGQCGSPLTYRSTNEPGHVDIMTCSLDNPEAVPPTLHTWTSHKLAWDRVTDGLA